MFVGFIILFLPKIINVFIAASSITKDGPSRTLVRLPKVLGEGSDGNSPSEAEEMLKRLQGTT